MALFFRTHECNLLCSRIKLQPFERCATDVAAQVGLVFQGAGGGGLKWQHAYLQQVAIGGNRWCLGGEGGREGFVGQGSEVVCWGWSCA
jgi:hypothetical protein